MKLQKFSGSLTCTVTPCPMMAEVVAKLVALGWEVVE